jgi:hypothetical protein
MLISNLRYEPTILTLSDNTLVWSSGGRIFHDINGSIQFTVVDSYVAINGLTPILPNWMHYVR